MGTHRLTIEELKTSRRCCILLAEFLRKTEPTAQAEISWLDEAAFGHTLIIDGLDESAEAFDIIIDEVADDVDLSKIGINQPQLTPEVI